MSWARKVRPRRLTLGLDQAEVSERSGVSVRTIRNIEQGEVIPQLDKLWQVMVALDMTPGGDEWPDGVEPYMRILAPFLARVPERGRPAVISTIIDLLINAGEPENVISEAEQHGL